MDFDPKTLEASISILFRCELAYSVKDQDGNIVEGGPDKMKKQKDLWTFSRKMRSEEPNWYLTKTE